MTKPRVVGIAVVVAAVGLIWWWTSRDRGSPATQVAPQPPGETVAKVQRNTTAKPAHLTVSVSDARGAIAGAMVRIGSGDDVSTLRTEASGEASTTVEAGSYRVAASAKDHEPGFAVREIKAGDDVRLDIKLALGGRSLSGMVTDATGGAIVGARIDAARVGGNAKASDAVAVAITGGDGRYELTVAQGQLQVSATHPDYSGQSRYVEVGAAGATADFALVPGAVVEGTVRDEGTKEAIADADVIVSRERGDRGGGMGGGRRRVKTTSDGRFRVTGLRPGSYEVVAQADDKSTRSPAVIGLGVADSIADLELLVWRAPVVKGLVVTPDGKPVAGASVRATESGLANDITTARDGSFVMTGLSPGRHFLTAASEHHVLVTGAQVELADKDVTGVRVTVEIGVTITGHVEPRQIAEVQLERAPSEERGPGLMMTPLAPVTTAADGTFALGPARAGAATVSARTESGDQGSRAVTVEPGMAEVIVRVAAAGSIAGRVVDGLTPVAGVTVTASPTGDVDRMTIVNGMVTSGVRALTGSKGEFEIAGLPGGTYRLSVLERGRAMKMASPPAPLKLAANEHKTNVELKVERANGTIKGHVVSSDGKPIAEAWVSAHQSIEDMVGSMLPDGGSGAGGGGGMRTITVEANEDGTTTNELTPALTDTNGNFTITGVPSGRWTVTAEAQAGKLRGRVRGVVPDATIEIIAAGVTSLAGTVHGDAGTPKVFEVELDGPTQMARSFATPDGSFNFARVDPGDYVVKVTSDLGSGESRVKVLADTATTVDVTLVANAYVVGKLVDPAGAPVSGMGVALVDDTGDGRVQVSLSGPPPVSAADGTFRLESKAGRKVLVALSPAAPTTKRGLVLEAGKTLDIGSLVVGPPPSGPTPPGPGPGSGSAPGEPLAPLAPHAPSSTPLAPSGPAMSHKAQRVSERDAAHFRSTRP